MSWYGEKTMFELVQYPENKRERVCRLCQSPIEDSVFYALRSVIVAGKHFDLFFHKSCFEDNMRNIGYGEKLH